LHPDAVWVVRGVGRGMRVFGVVIVEGEGTVLGVKLNIFLASVYRNPLVSVIVASGIDHEL